jgi:hypothetical protein
MNSFSWQATQNANRAAYDAARRVSQAESDSRRLARGRGPASVLGNVIALLIVLAILALAASFVVGIIADFGL